MRLTARIALMFVAMLLIALPLCAETYTVDGARGDDSNDGIAAPFRTIARGVQATGPGDTLRIVPMDEPYPETLRLTRHGRRGAPITIEGGGATLTGADPLPAEGWSEQDGTWQLPLKAHDRMMLFGNERHFIKGGDPANLEPEQWRWADGTLYFRPAEGKTPADYDLRASIERASGVATSGAGLIIVRDLRCINFWNDGYNLHGGTGPMWFENIVGNWNGDEGFSAHENAECYVRGGEFSNNYWHGINDIIYSRTHFVDVVCRDNRSKGVRFNGGLHSLTDCEVSGSPINVELLPYSQTNFPHSERHPLAVSFTNLRNTVVRSTADEVGVYVGPNSEAVIEHCLLQGGAPVIDVQPRGKAFVVNSIVVGGEQHEIVAGGEYIADHNLYHPGRFLVAGTQYAPDAFADYRAATGNDANSLIAEPVPAEDGVTLVSDSPGYRGADSGAYGGFAMGPEDRAREAAGGAAGVGIVQGEAEELEGGGRRIVFDFEEENPWSRIYPVPEQSQGGIAVAGTSELTDEQAHSGTKSAKLQVTTPVAPPGGYNIKLFSQNLPFDREVRRLSFWLYGDGSGRGARPRIRDAGGESFYGTSFRIDWEGWRQLTWDLDETPPTNIAGGNENKRQDGPTMELVLEIDQPAGSEMTLFFDDLAVELAPEGWTTPAPGGQPAARPTEAEAPVLAGERQGEQMVFDFEEQNAWGRTYPEPAEVGGAQVPASSELSTEQARSGARSAKVTMSAPAGSPAGLGLKLFTEDIDTGGPVSAWSVWVYAEQRLPFKLRIRDIRGESFYGPGIWHEGNGWQELAWDLTQTPPEQIAGGDEDRAQDAPLEFVLTTSIKPGEGQTELVYYVDDLTLTLGEGGPPPAAQPEAEAPAADRPADYVAIDLPAPEAPAPEGVTEALPGGGTRYSWDFEASNPWNRIYPVPEENQAGARMGGVAELSGEQAHSGATSGKVLVQIPPSPPGGFEIKLFSPRFQFFDRPVRRIAFWIHTDDEPLSYRLRVRDASGEGYYGPPRRLEGTGWQRVEWDLQAEPPATVRGGDGNGVQNGPPIEIVMEYQVKAGAGWTERTIYVDDLEVELAP